MENPTGWRVVSQAHSEAYTAGGTWEEVVKVHGVTDVGTAFTLTIPAAQYSVPNVIARGDDLAARLNAVASLGNA